MNYENSKEVRNTLLDAIERTDRKMVYTTLTNYTQSDHISIWIYDGQKRELHEMELQKTIAIDDIDPRSLLSEAIYDKSIKLYKHITSDKNYNPEFDNPYRIKLRSQLVIPVVESDRLMGIIRLSRTIKSTANYTHHMIENIREIYPVLIELCSCLLGAEGSQRGPFKCVSAQESEEVSIRTEAREIKKLLKDIFNKSSNGRIIQLVTAGMQNIDQILMEFDAERQAEEPRVSQTPTIKKEKLNILIVDDTRLNTSILKALLTDQRFEISIADDGDVALEKLEKMRERENSIDILFLDHHMPRMLGSEVAQHIVKEPKKYTDGKIYIVSITNDPEAILDKKYLYDFHIRKPFMKAEIMNVVEKIENIIG